MGKNINETNIAQDVLLKHALELWTEHKQMFFTPVQLLQSKTSHKYPQYCLHLHLNQSQIKHPIEDLKDLGTCMR